MPRPKRNIVAGGEYLWVTDSTHGQSVFIDDDDRRTYREIMKTSAKLGKILIIELSLSANAVCLVFVPCGTEITTFTRRLQGLYARYFCEKYGVRGQIWRTHAKCMLLSERPSTSIKRVTKSQSGPQQAGLKLSPGLKLVLSLFDRDARVQWDALENYLFPRPDD